MLLRLMIVLIVFCVQKEEARTRGTPVTPESFKAWREMFMKEIAIKQAREEEEKMKGMTPKEREEYKKLATRPSGALRCSRVAGRVLTSCTGRQLFESDKTLYAADDGLLEEGTVSVDFSQYERETVEEEEEESGVTFSDSD